MRAVARVEKRRGNEAVKVNQSVTQIKKNEKWKKKGMGDGHC